MGETFTCSTMLPGDDPLSVSWPRRWIRSDGFAGRPPFPFIGTASSSRANATRAFAGCSTCTRVTAAMLVRIVGPQHQQSTQTAESSRGPQAHTLVGAVSQKIGRPENVYCRWTPNVNQLLHEVQLTQLCFQLDAEKILRGPHALDATIRPDAEVWINGTVYYVEWDRGTDELRADHAAPLRSTSSAGIWPSGLFNGDSP